jgi:GT2 family glycosyltransferase
MPNLIATMLADVKSKSALSLEILRRATPPMQVVMVDIDQPLPQHLPAHGYTSAFVVAISRGVPRGTAVLNLGSDGSLPGEELNEFVRDLELGDTNAFGNLLIAEKDLPKISVVVPSAITRLDDLRRCLDSIRESDYPDFDVILVDNRSSVPSPDPLEDVINERPWLHVVHESRRGSSIARNTGAAALNGDIIAFTDDDVRVDRNWLRAIGTRMTLTPAIELLLGLILPAELESPAQIWFERYFGGMGTERTFRPVTLEPAPEVFRLLRGRSVLVRDSRGREMRRISLYGAGGYGASANMAIRRTTLERVEGFDPTLGAGTPAFGGEDIAMVIDVLWTGGTVGYEPAAFVWHRHRRGYDELLRQTSGYATGVSAMLTRMILDDPRHLLCIASKLHVAAKVKLTDARRLKRGSADSDSQNSPTASFPPILFRREVMGLISGPFSYLRSWAWWRHESRR